MMGVAAPAGAVVGASTAPGNERKENHAIYWSAIFGAIAAVAGNYFYSDNKEIEALRKENKELKDPVLTFLGEGSDNFNKFDKSSPKEKVKWHRKKIDQWVKESPTKMFHKDEVIEIIDQEKGK